MTTNLDDIYKVGDSVRITKTTITPFEKFDRGQQLRVTEVIGSKVNLVDDSERTLTIPYTLADHIEKV